MASSKAGARFFENKFADYSQAAEGAKCMEKEECLKTMQKYLDSIQRRQPPNREYCEGATLYTGYGGIAYMYLHLASSSEFAASRDEYLELAKQYVEIAIDYFRSSRSAKAEEAFLSGPLGVYAVAACIYKQLSRMDKVSEFTEWVEGALSKALRSESDELFVGKAGYLCAIQLLQQFGVRLNVSNQRLRELYDSILQDGRAYVRNNACRCCVGDKLPKLMFAYHGKEYLGAAHGLSGILKVLLTYCESNADVIVPISAPSEVSESVDFLLNNCQQRNGNFPTNLSVARGESSRPESEELLHFCHGAPGFVLLFLAAFDRFGDGKYLNAAVQCGELIWQRGLLRKGPGLCHGVAGNAYCFLQLYRAMKNAGDAIAAEKYLYRAHMFAKFLNCKEFKEANTPDHPHSLFEGVAGTVCLLCDLMQPDKSQYPLFAVFVSPSTQ